jgi:hypothetical protein
LLRFFLADDLGLLYGARNYLHIDIYLPSMLSRRRGKPTLNAT